MPQYLFSVVDDELTRQRPAAEAQPIFEAVDALNSKLQREGHWVFAGGLTGLSEAKTVDARDAEAVVTDGPFAETKEYLGGFWVVDLLNLDAALELAAEASRACQGKVEVRPFADEPPTAD